MAKQKEGVQDRILECAKVEFLEKGFTSASLRVIAKNANTSTSSIYTRFIDKEGLFESLVDPVIHDLKKWFLDKQEDFHNLPCDVQKEVLFSKEQNHIPSFIDYVYDNFEIFKLLITRSEGTKFSNLIHELCNIDVEYTYKYLKATNIYNKHHDSSKDLFHIITSAYYNGLFETVTHDMSREKAHIYSKKLTKFFICGWKNLLHS